MEPPEPGTLWESTLRSVRPPPHHLRASLPTGASQVIGQTSGGRSVGPELHDDGSVVAVGLPFVRRNLDYIIQPAGEIL